MKARILLVSGLLCPFVFAQDFPPPPRPAPPQPQHGPWNNDVLVYQVKPDGSPEKLTTFERAGVPTLARLPDGRILAAYQHFPTDDERNFDRVAARFSADEGRTWTNPVPIQVEGMEEGLMRPFDPTLVPLPDGRIRLYFTSNRHGRIHLSKPEIYSAISNDGMRYVFEPGVRFAVEGRVVIDCAVALHQGVFHLYAPDNGATPQPGQDALGGQGVPSFAGYHATSQDGLTFTRAADVTAGEDVRWLGNVQSQGEDLIFFGTGAPRGTSGVPGEPPRSGIWMGRSRDGAAWERGRILAIPGADPGAVPALDGGWIVAVTGPPRGGRQGPGVVPGPGEPSERRPDGPRPGEGSLRVEKVESSYKAAPTGEAGTFSTAQAGDLMLGGFGFNRSGGPLALNHPSGLATDGRCLLVADRWNNRVLLWKEAPAANTPPHIVLGQKDFDTNDPGTALDQLNWPGNVALGEGGRLAVADTNNDRVLLWNSMPERNGQAADVELRLESYSAPGDQQRPGWPWGVWTDGSRLAVVATHGGAILVWEEWPALDNQPPSTVLRPENAGTPRNITSDGTFLMVSDHNHRGTRRPGPPGSGGGMAGGPATMVWKSWPDRPDQAPDFVWPGWYKGTATPEGGLILAGIQSVSLWEGFPGDAGTAPTIRLAPSGYRNGDGPDAVIAAGRLYVCNYNGSNILVWNSLPGQPDTPPGFAVGSDGVSEDVWAKRFQIQNPIVATDGTSLFASSDFDRKLFVWKRLPDESGAKPDLVYHLPEGPWDNAVHGSCLVLGGRQTVYVWKSLPLDGQMPDAVLRRRIGSVELREITGVALDDQHLYVADRQAHRVYVWQGIPDPDDEPVHILEAQNPGRLSSDGTWLVIAPFDGQDIVLHSVDDLAGRKVWLSGRGRFNLPGKAIVAAGRFFVANTSHHRVDVWEDVNAALRGAPPDAHLGASGPMDHAPGIGQEGLFMPGSLAYDGTHLWVGEFKFSTRILRYSPAGEDAVAASPVSDQRMAEDSRGTTDWGAFWSQGRGEGRGPVSLSHSPMRLEDLERFVPYGMTAGGHVCPIDHAYFFPKQNVVADVIAPADGHIVVLAHRTQLTGSTERARVYDDYALVIEHSGTFYTQFDLLDSLDGAVVEAMELELRRRLTGKETLPQTPVRIPVKAGQVLGKVSGRSLDFGVIDTETRLAGFLSPALYGHYSWRVHLTDPFPHFADPVRRQILERNVRKVAPFGGKIDYDVPGKLSGNWFLEGSGGYAGDRSDPRGYWMGHLAFACHHIDPRQIIVSVGDYGGQPRTFRVKGNAPDPAVIGEQDGVVKYELIDGRLGSDGQRQVRHDADIVQGVALAQVLEGEKLRFEVFPDCSASDVAGFTANARSYER
jgi:hypothetical protein